MLEIILAIILLPIAAVSVLAFIVGSIAFGKAIAKILREKV